MKNRSLILCVALLLALMTMFVMTACQGDQTPSAETDTEAVTGEVTQAETSAAEDTVADTQASEETTSEVVTEAETLRPLEWESYDPALDNSEVDTTATHTVDPTQWVAVDGLDRVLPTNTQTGDVREDKTVAMFYWTWHGNFAGDQYAYNNQRNLDILAANGLTEEDYFTMKAYTLKQQYGVYTANASDSRYHFWDEPIFGYYDGDDEWVIRKHAEMLAAAGVDVVFFDNTNGEFTWMETALKVMKVFSEARAQGVDAPDVSFLLPFGGVEHAGNQMIKLYTQIYEKELYKDVWYMLDGKPMLMAWPNSFNMDKETHKQYGPIIQDFFTFRGGIGAYEDKTTAPGYWGWLSVFPQQYYYNAQGDIEQITVGVAINHNYVDHVLAPMSGDNIISRTWTSKGYDTRENAMYYGACFAEQWENAITVDPSVVFVTGWNEWVAMKLQHWTGDYYNCFVDQYNDEYSRDCEPSNGPMKDYYYYQLISYIRQYKGTTPIEVATEEKLMDVNGGYGQWADVGPTYTDYFGLTDRDFNGYKDPETNQPLHYTNDTGRNDIYDAKVARDYENIYFMVRTVDALTPYTDPDWMRLYISTGDSDKHWEHYEYVLNKTNPTATEATLERFTGDGYATEVVGKVTYAVSGNVMTVCIPKTMLGIPADCYEFTFDFKWVDNANEDEAGDIMLWYSNGDVAPIARFNYCYTTSAFAENEQRPAYGFVDLDMTNTEYQAIIEGTLKDEAGNIKTDMVEGMTYTFDDKGLTMTSTAAGEDTKLYLDYTKSPTEMVSNNYNYVAITYVCSDESVKDFRMGWLTEGGSLATMEKRSKSVDVVADGEAHTIVIDMSKAREWSGTLQTIGLYFGKTQVAGASITITSIEFFSENPEA